MLKDGFVLAGPDATRVEGSIWIASGSKSLPTVILCPGFGEFKDGGFFPHVAESLAVAGFAVVGFNYGHSGAHDSEPKLRRPKLLENRTITAELFDLKVVIRSLLDGMLPGSRSFDLGRLGLLGHGDGGALALVAAVQNPAVTSVVTWSAPSKFVHVSRSKLDRWREEDKLNATCRWTGQRLRVGGEFLRDVEKNGYDPCVAIGRLPVPCLLLHGENDKVIPRAHAERLFQAAAVEEIEAIFLPDADHDLGAAHPFRGTTEELERAISLSRAFFSDTLC